jgi:hypothetical protein
MNTTEDTRMYEISVAGLPTLQIVTEPSVLTGPTESRMVPVRLRVDPDQVAPGTHKIRFSVRAMDDARVAVEEQSVFIVR